MVPTAMRQAPRPRVTGEREREVLLAALAVLGEVGYDRLTMDAVALRAKASKATLYRRWEGKLALVIEALQCMKAPTCPTDTGSLRGDLNALFCSGGGLDDETTVSAMAAVLTAVHRDADFATAFRAEVVGPKAAQARAAWERARDRGEIPAETDIDLFAQALPGIVLHRAFVMGERPDAELVSRVIDQIILPAVHAGPTLPHASDHPGARP